MYRQPAEKLQLTKAHQEVVAAVRSSSMSEVGHSRPMHSVPVPINVRCYFNSDIIIRRSEVTLRANKRHRAASFDHVVGAAGQCDWHYEAEDLGCLEVDH